MAPKAKAKGDGAPPAKKSRKGAAKDDAPLEDNAALDADLGNEEDLTKRPDPSVGAPIIVIHPGSTCLRIGLASSPSPRVLPHCIAFRKSEAAAPQPSEPSSAAKDEKGAADAAVTAFEPVLGLLARQLRLGVQLIGQTHKNVPPTAKKLPASAAPPVAAADAEGEAAVGENSGGPLPNFRVGEAALAAAHDSPAEWELLYPMQFGTLNQHGGISECAVLSALHTIWQSALLGGGGQPGLGLSASELPQCCAVLALPDLFDRRVGSALLSLLLHPSGLNCKAAICHEEAACAAFGAGVSSACVVDVGHQRTSISCVDEGMPMPGCRQLLAYGGLDLDVLTHILLHRQRLVQSLPSLARCPSYNPSLLTARALGAIRHASCSLELHADPKCLPYTDVFPVAASASTAGGGGGSGGSGLRVQLGSLAPLPGLLLFVPRVAASLQSLLGFQGPPSGSPSSAHVQADLTDVWDDDFLADSALERALPAGVTPAGPKDLFLGAANYAPELSETGQRHASGLTPESQLGFMPLDEAVVRAVERGKSTEVKRRLYGTILLLGGNARTPGLGEYLEWRVATCWKIASDSTEGIERVEVVRLPEGTEPESIAWRGAATLPSLETARGLWILRKEWELQGALAARQACAFAW